jgi:Zn finger protein HypA/HybF involved in hydrogenase expression
MKLLAGALTAVLLGAAAGGPCDIKTVEKGLWCRKCGEELQKAALKGGSCAECGSKPVEADFCVKKQYSRSPTSAAERSRKRRSSGPAWP